MTSTLFIAGKVGREELPISPESRGYRQDESPAYRVGRCIVAELLEDTFPPGTVVSVRTAADDAPIDRDRFLDLAILTSEGALVAEYAYQRFYSEVTPEELTERLEVGGHDLLDLIDRNEGRYMAILISDAPIPDLADALAHAAPGGGADA